MRRTKIVCTIGPASQEEDILREIIKSGMNVARFNFSHGDHEEHGRKLERVRRISRELHLPVAVLLDTRGPEIRLCDFENGKTELKEGQRFTLTTEDILGTSERATITYKNLVNDVKPGNSILLDDGLIGLRVEEVTDKDIICTVLNGGPISNHKGVNVPGAKLTMPFIDKKDRNDIIYACEMGFDFIAASFVRCKEDVLEIREILKQYNSKIQIISKIETIDAVEHLKEILPLVKYILVDRGDLSTDIGIAKIPRFQKYIIEKALYANVKVFLATQVLKNMETKPIPTIGEIEALYEIMKSGVYGVQMSEETAVGRYVPECVAMLNEMSQEVESETIQL